jgi:hypothetical protein
MLILKADRIGTTPRIPVCYPVIFQTKWYKDEGEVLNLSVPGCAIESPRCPVHDEYVCLQLLLPNNVVRVEVAKVRWAECNRFGLEFLKLTEDHKERLFGLLKDFYA